MFCASSCWILRVHEDRPVSTTSLFSAVLVFSCLSVSFVTHLHCSFLLFSLSFTQFNQFLLELYHRCRCTHFYIAALWTFFLPVRENILSFSLQCSIKQCNGLQSAQSSGHSVLKRATNRQLSASLLSFLLNWNQKTKKPNRESKAFTTTTPGLSITHLNCTRPANKH